MTPPSTSTGSGPDPGQPPPLDVPRPGRRRVLGVAFAASAVLHALVIALYPLLVGAPPPAPSSSAPEERALRGMEVVRVAEVETPEQEEAEPPREFEEPEEPRQPEGFEVADEPGPTADPIGPPERRALTAAEELRPRAGDPRLSAPLPEEVVAVNEEWLARLRIIWAIEALNDSATAAAATAAAAREWTYTDDEGRKWGISPGKVHLGDITLPLPFSFAAPYNSDAARRAREDAEILRAAIEAATRETLEERARAIRERKARERANGTPPDTTGGRGGGSSGA